LIDFVIKPSLLIRVTVGQSHKGAISRLDDIVKAMRHNVTTTPNTTPPLPDVIMLFVLRDSNFEDFSRVEGLNIEQYKTNGAHQRLFLKEENEQPSVEYPVAKVAKLEESEGKTAESNDEVEDTL
jgi:hypothetical protein